LQIAHKGLKYSWNDDAAVPDPKDKGTLGFVATRVLFYCQVDVKQLRKGASGNSWL
jgi:hypothetical protein